MTEKDWKEEIWSKMYKKYGVMLAAKRQFMEILTLAEEHFKQPYDKRAIEVIKKQDKQITDLKKQNEELLSGKKLQATSTDCEGLRITLKKAIEMGNQRDRTIKKLKKQLAEKDTVPKNDPLTTLSLKGSIPEIDKRLKKLGSYWEIRQAIFDVIRKKYKLKKGEMESYTVDAVKLCQEYYLKQNEELKMNFDRMEELYDRSRELRDKKNKEIVKLKKQLAEKDTVPKNISLDNIKKKAESELGIWESNGVKFMRFMIHEWENFWKELKGSAKGG